MAKPMQAAQEYLAGYVSAEPCLAVDMVELEIRMAAARATVAELLPETCDRFVSPKKPKVFTILRRAKTHADWN